jgi:hypothetical protein
VFKDEGGNTDWIRGREWGWGCFESMFRMVSKMRLGDTVFSSKWLLEAASL